MVLRDVRGAKGPQRVNKIQNKPLGLTSGEFFFFSWRDHWPCFFQGISPNIEKGRLGESRGTPSQGAARGGGGKLGGGGTYHKAAPNKRIWNPPTYDRFPLPPIFHALSFPQRIWAPTMPIPLSEASKRVWSAHSIVRLPPPPKPHDTFCPPPPAPLPVQNSLQNDLSHLSPQQPLFSLKHALDSTDMCVSVNIPMLLAIFCPVLPFCWTLDHKGFDQISTATLVPSGCFLSASLFYVCALSHWKM